MRYLVPLVLAVVISAVSLRGAAPPAPPAAPASTPRVATRTNFPPGPARPAPRTNAPPATKPGPVPGSKTNVLAAGKTNAATATGTNALARGLAGARTAAAKAIEAARGFRQSRWFVPGVLGLAAILGVVLVLRSRKAKAATAEAAPTSTAAAGAKSLKQAPAKIHSCVVLQTGGPERKLWQFDARSHGFTLSREQTSATGERLPQKLVAKDWRSLYQPKLNIAWLPSEHVFLRVIQLPRSDLGETLSMVELQMEKLSPMPVAQVVWSIQVLPHSEQNQQTVIVLIAARDAVEEFLGTLEEQGCMTDRLELPALDQLEATPVKDDGAYIYPQTDEGRNTALVAWWYKGVLRNLDLISLPAANRPASLREQLTQMAWAGELEGWLTASPQWHLVADGATTGDWESALREGLQQPVQLVPRLPSPQLAARTAARVARAESVTNLMPQEYATRYQQQFVDRLWMRSLGAVVAVYLVGVVIYLIALQFVLFQTRAVEEQVADMGPTYTNALQLKAKFQVLNDRQELKFAALDCWNTTASLLPKDATLDTYNFSDGKKLVLQGNAPSDQIQSLIRFEADMRKAEINGQPLFDRDRGESISTRQTGPTAVSWNFSLELKRAEMQ